MKPFLFSRILVLYYFACMFFYAWFRLDFILTTVYYRDRSWARNFSKSIILVNTYSLVKEMIPQRFHFIIDINPITYFIDGYRNSLVYETIILPEFNQSLYFWVFAYYCMLVKQLLTI